VKNRLKFLLERLMLRGAHYRLLLIAAAIGLVSIVAGTIVFAADAGEFGSFGGAVWWAFLRLTDPGYLGDDEGALLRVVSTIVTVLGYVIFLGALIAIMTQWLNRTMRNLESGFTPIAERNHILLLGWTNRTSAVVRELMLSEGRVRRFLRRRHTRRLRIVILAEEVTSELSQELRERLGPLWKERQIILRTGTPLRIEHLRRVDFLRAAAIVLPAADFESGGAAEADTRAIKTLLSITNQAGGARAELPLVVAEIFDARKLPVARRAYGGEVELLASDALISRLIAQNVRHRGLSHVYSELLTHGRGNELYIREPPESFVGASVRGLAHAFPRAILLGIVRPDAQGFQPCLNPGGDVDVRADDRLVLLARSYAHSGVADAAQATEPPAMREPAQRPPPPPPKRVLVLGWSHKVAALLREFDSYAGERFVIDLMSYLPVEERSAHLRRHDLDLERVELRQLEGDYTAPADLRRVEPASYDNVVFLGSDWLESGEQSDARTILGYLLLRELLAEAQRPDVLIELLDPGNVSLFRRRAGEVLISPVLLSHMLAQVVLRRELRAVFDELFGPHGTEITFEPASHYAELGREISFRDVERRAAERCETALGVRIAHAAAEHLGGVNLNPARDQKWAFTGEDEVVVLTTFA
jgi:ion channel POLLUX/CASTOR